jgi:hypothetical protein
MPLILTAVGTLVLNVIVALLGPAAACGITEVFCGHNAFYPFVRVPARPRAVELDHSTRARLFRNIESN